MARRSLLTFLATAIVFFSLGATGVYLALSIPNDIKAEALLKEARSDLQTGSRDQARQKFETVVKNYPRTDAAAAASYALFRLLDQDRKELAEQLEKVETERDALRATLRKEMGDLDKRVAEAAQKAQEAAAKPAPPPPKPTVSKKPAPRRTTTRRRRG